MAALAAALVLQQWQGALRLVISGKVWGGDGVVAPRFSNAIFIANIRPNTPEHSSW